MWPEDEWKAAPKVLSGGTGMERPGDFANEGGASEKDPSTITASQLDESVSASSIQVGDQHQKLLQQQQQQWQMFWPAGSGLYPAGHPTKGPGETVCFCCGSIQKRTPLQNREVMKRGG